MNRNSVIVTFFGCVFACHAMSGKAQSATFAFVDNGYCKIALSGPIQSGDFQRLQSAIERVKRAGGSRFSVCLNSLGGDYDEGLKMARLLLERGVGTVVLQHRQCYSACAIMFMFGSFWGTDSARWPNRRLGMEAALGFHAPYKQGSDAPDPNATYSANFQQGVRAIGSFLTALYQSHSLGSDGSKFTIDRDSLDAFFAPELMAAMISKGPDEAFLIRTLNDAGRWGIDVITSSDTPLNLENIFQACHNASSWRIFHEAAEVLTRDQVSKWSDGADKPVILRQGSKTLAVLPGFGKNPPAEACVVEQFPLSDGRMHVNVRIVAKDEAQATPEPDNVPWSPEEIAWVRGYDESWYLLPPTNTLCSESCATVRDTPGQ